VLKLDWPIRVICPCISKRPPNTTDVINVLEPLLLVYEMHKKVSLTATVKIQDVQYHLKHNPSTYYGIKMKSEAAPP
jgi:hypothetical protein